MWNEGILKLTVPDFKVSKFFWKTKSVRGL